ncbi:MAG: transketolase family protein [Erysipelotrichaceae bacterium]|nr:transketolase family protein [Erysipelotrichaceae bacterium]
MAGTIYGAKIQGMRGAVGDALVELGQKNDRVVVIDAETAVATNIAPFQEAFPDRFLTTCIAEQNAISVAYGLARMGFIPFVPLFASFISRRAFDQVFVHAGYPNANIKMMGGYAGLTAASVGATHQAINDINIMRTVPNLTVIEACDPDELHDAILKAAEIEGPVYIRVVRSDLPEYEVRQTPEGYHFEVGKAAVLKEGTDVSLVGSGIMVARCKEAAEKLAEQGISAEVINVSTIKPLDVETIINSARKTNHVVTAEGNSVLGGLGSAVAEALCENHPCRLGRVGVLDRYGHSGLDRELLKLYNLTTEDIVDKALEILNK